MASSYSTNLRLELMATGENNNTWGTRANSSVFQMVDEAFGYVEVNAAGSGNITLSTNNGSADESRPTVIKLTGVRTAIGNIIVPTAEKFWIFWNATTGGYDLTVKTSGGSGIAVGMDERTLLYADGTNVLDGINFVSSLTLGSALPIASGGTGGTSASAARTALGAAASGANSDITSLSGLSTALSVAQGGTGATSAAAALTALGAAAIAGSTFTGQIKLPDFSDVASSATTDLGAVNSNFVRITGTTAITSFGTVAAGTWKIVRFNGALTLTYNATSLITPSAANITTAANDFLIAISLGSGNWVVTHYQTATGRALVRELNPPLYESSEQSIATGTLYTFTHGLGYLPQYRLVLRCKTTEYGYQVGDEIDVTTVTRNNMSILSSSTNIRFITNSSSPSFETNQYSSPGAAQVQLTNANWRIVCYAW